MYKDLYLVLPGCSIERYRALSPLSGSYLIQELYNEYLAVVGSILSTMYEVHDRVTLEHNLMPIVFRDYLELIYAV